MLFGLKVIVLLIHNLTRALAKPNVPFVRLAKIVFKKCAVGRNKNTEALAFGSAV